MSEEAFGNLSQDEARDLLNIPPEVTSTIVTDLGGLSYVGNGLKVLRVKTTEDGWEFAATAVLTDGDKGDIVVSGTGTVWTIDTGAVSLAKMANVATGAIFYRKTAGAGAPEVQTLATLKTDLALVKADVGLGSADNTADAAKAVLSATKLVTARSLSMSGDVVWTVSFDGTAAATAAGTIQASAVTLAKMADIATSRFIGRVTAGTGAPEALTGTQATSLLDTFGTLKGLVPGVASATNKYLQADATWASALTPASLAASGTVTGSNLSGTNTGDQTITLSGDVSGSGTSAITVTIAAAAVTNAKLATMAQATLKGRAAGAGTGAPVDLTATQAKTLLAIAAADVSGLAAIATSGSASDLSTGTVAIARLDVGTSGAKVPILNGAASTWAAGSTWGGEVAATKFSIGSEAEQGYNPAFVAKRNVSDFTLGSAHGFSDSTVISGYTGASNAYNSFEARCQFTGSGNLLHWAGFQFNGTIGTSGTTTDLWGYFAAPIIDNGTVTNFYGTEIMSLRGTGAVGTAYGVLIRDLARGTTRYGLKQEGATDLNQFAGQVSINNYLFVTGNGTVPTTGIGVAFNYNSAAYSGAGSGNLICGNYADGTLRAMTYDALQHYFRISGTDVGSFTSTGLTLNGLTASQLVATNGSKTLQTLATASYPSLAEITYVKGVTSAIQTQLDGKQPLDSDLTTLAGLTATTDNFIVSVASAWASRTPAQVRVTLGLATIATSGSASDLSAGTLPAARMPALTGDATTVAGAVAVTFATVNPNVGSFGSATQSLTVTVNAKGLITAISAQVVTPAVGSITGLGTGVATALGVNVGSAGAFVTFNGAGGTPSSVTLTNATGLPISSGVSGLASGIATFLATPSSANLITAVTDETGTGALVFGTTPTLATPVINGLPTGTGVASGATASTLVSRDANGNAAANNFVEGFTTTATAAGTTTLTIAATYTQVFTGSSTQTVKLPTTSVLQGQQYLLVNQSTGAVTVQSSAANTIVVLAPGTSAFLTAVIATPTAAADWSFQYAGVNAASGKVGTLNNTLTLAGTDGTTITFPSTSATVARTDAANTFTGHQTIEGVTSTGATGTGKFVFDTSPALVTPALGTPSSGTLTNATGLPIAGLVASTATAIGVGSIELGHASDTSITRVSAGVVAIEGANILVSGGALGTPASGTLTNATGLPISTGVSGLGSGVAAFLATPSSANLATALTDETGTAGSLVFSAGPTFTGTVLTAGVRQAGSVAMVVENSFGSLPSGRTGAGLEFGAAQIQSYNRTSNAYNTLNIAADPINLQWQGATKLAIVTGGANVTGALTATTYLKTGATTVAGLPSAATAGAGASHFVTDATATTFASTVVGGGANAVPVYSDGTNWKIG